MRTQHHQEHLSFEKVWQMFQESDKRWEKKFNKLEGFFTSQWEKFIEALISGDLINLLKERNIHVNQTATRVKTIYRDKQYEFDIIAMNGEEMVVVEVKTTLNIADVNYFLEDLKEF